MNPLITFVLWLLCYGVGSIPSGFLVSYAWGIEDIRSRGSGNTGATNVSRSLGWWAFIVVFLLDAGKAYFALYFISNKLLLSYDAVLIAAFCLLVGNIYSLFLQFQAGKGVATIVGLYSFVFPSLCVFMIAVWVIAFIFFKRAGIASVCAVLFSVIAYFMVFLPCAKEGLFLVSSAALVIMRHRSNIRQYLNL